MYRKQWINTCLVAVLALASLGTGLAAVAAPNRQATTPATMEPELQAALQANGQANLFVMFREQADLTPAYHMSWDQRGEYVYNALLEVAQRSQAAVRASLDAQGIPYQSFPINNSLYIPGASQAVANSLLSFPEVAYLRLERVLPLPEPVQVDAPPVVPEATTDWGLTDTKATSVWALGYQGAGIKVANIDTGVQYNHPALDQAYACAGNPGSSACWYDPTGTYPSAPGDNNGHGTHTMGTMVGDDDSSLAYIVGMAPDATWIACKGCSSSSCSDSHLTACANWILQPGGNTANRPHIVNNSWGGGGGDTWYLSYVNAWRAAGIFPAFSAGNSGSSCNTLGSPGDYQESFASAAHSSSRTIASFSSRGPSAFGHDPYTKPNISAPGVSICSSVPTNSWSCSYSGTSMASPHAAGAVALIWQACPSYKGNIDATFQLLQNNADAPPAGNCSAPPDGQGNYTYGYGYLNVLAAVNACAGGPPPTPTPTPTPTPPPSGGVLWLSLSANASLGNLGTVNDEDIVALNLSTGVYSWVFDGSDVGITTDIDAFDVLPNGHLLMSFDASTSVTGIGTVGDADVVEFTPTSLGDNTAGTFTWKFDGSDVGLSDRTEDVDALYFLADGTMVVSTRDTFSVSGISGQDEDLIRFTATSWGSTTAGTWSWYFDGSDVGLATNSSEDVDAIWVNEAVTPNPDIYLCTLGNFSVSGVSGANEDIFVFHPTSLGSTTAGTFGPGLYFDGSLYGLSSYDLDAFDVQQ